MCDRCCCWDAAFDIVVVVDTVAEEGEGETYFAMLSIPGVTMMFMICFVEEISQIASLTMLSLWLTDTVSYFHTIVTFFCY